MRSLLWIYEVKSEHRYLGEPRLLNDASFFDYVRANRNSKEKIQFNIELDTHIVRGRKEKGIESKQNAYPLYPHPPDLAPDFTASSSISSRVLFFLGTVRSEIIGKYSLSGGADLINCVS